MSIPETHLSEKNYWILKPVDLFQGRCIKISNEPESILKKLRKYFNGLNDIYNDSGEEVESKPSNHHYPTQKNILKTFSYNIKFSNQNLTIFF